MEAGRDVVIVTPTASGKTLCYNLPILQPLLERPGQPRPVPVSDQGAVRRPARTNFTRRRGDGRRYPRLHLRRRHPAGRPQGDPPARQRRADQSRHAARRDSAASHAVGQVFRESALHRHRRAALPIAAFTAAIWRTCSGASAASANSTARSRSSSAARRPSPIPSELAEALIERPVRRSKDNGAPSGEKFFVFYNPPVVNRQLGIRRSYIHETRRMRRDDSCERGQQTLVFANNRLATEILVTYLKDACERGHIPSETDARLSRRLPAARAPRDRAAAAQWRDSRRGGDQRPRAGHRYRLARCRGDGGISGHHRLDAGSARAARDGASRSRPP